MAGATVTHTVCTHAQKVDTPACVLRAWASIAVRMCADLYNVARLIRSLCTGACTSMTQRFYISPCRLIVCQSKVEYVSGTAKLTSNRTVEVDGGRLTFSGSHILLATGGRPSVPTTIAGAEYGITSDGFFELKELPRLEIFRI